MISFQRTFLWRCVAAGLCLLLVSTLVWRAWAQDTLFLRVSNAEGKLLFASPLSQEQEFGIRFVHSVAKSPVEEWFTGTEGKIFLHRTVYQDFGAGLPHDEGAGQRMEFRHGQIVLSGFTLELPRLEVRVGRVAGHELLLPPADPQAKGEHSVRALPLTVWAKPGETLIFSVGRLFVWESIIRGVGWL